MGRLQENLDVQPERPGGRILQVHTNHVVEFHSTSSGDLPQAGDSRLRGQQAGPVPNAVGLHFVGDWRSGADDRHLALQDIQKLRQFIQAGSSQETPDGGDARGRLSACTIASALAAAVRNGDEALHILLVDALIVFDVH